MDVEVIEKAMKKPTQLSEVTGVDHEIIKQMVEIFKSLSDQSRLQILMLLARGGEMHVSAICKEVHQSQPAVSHHLTQLKNARLVDYRRDGKFNFYKLDSAVLSNIFRTFFPNAANKEQSFSFDTLQVHFRSNA
jgi:ArsR family transcriptional regulator, arsenate/arsenite/antimonite-responsive transcriptional repressor